MKHKVVLILFCALTAVMPLMLLAGCGEDAASSETTTTKAATTAQPTTAKSTVPKTTAPTTTPHVSNVQNNNEEYQNDSSAEGYYAEQEDHNSDVPYDANVYDENADSNESPQESSKASKNHNNNDNYAEIPGEGEIVIHGDPDYVGAE